MKLPTLSIKHLVVSLTFLAVFAMVARISMDTDTWWHLRAGQWIVENRSVLRHDPFSHTRLGEEWHYPGWLVEVPMYVIYQAFGPGGLNLWTATMVAVTFWFVWKTLSGGEFVRAFVIILAAAASGVYWAARPHLMTFLLTGVFLWIFEENQKLPDAHSHDSGHQTQRKIWLLPLLMIVWANSHGGFAVGFILWGVYFLSAVLGLLWDWFENRRQTADGGLRSAVNSQRVKMLFIIGLLMTIAVCINPSGPVMLLYPFKTVAIEVLRDFIQEWQSPNFHNQEVLPFLLLLLLTLGALGVSKKRISSVDFFLLAGFTYLSLLAGRNIALFALVAPMVLTRHAVLFLQELGERSGFRRSIQPPPRTTRWQSTLNWIILGLLITTVVIKAGMVIPKKVNQEHFMETLPVEAVAYLRAEQLAGKLFNSYNWGGYLLWSLPEYPVFVDGRTDLYGDELIGEWIQVVQAEDGWENVLDDWDVNLIMLEHTRPVVSELADAGWDLLYEDEIAVIFVQD